MVYDGLVLFVEVSLELLKGELLYRGKDIHRLFVGSNGDALLYLSVRQKGVFARTGRVFQILVLNQRVAIVQCPLFHRESLPIVRCFYADSVGGGARMAECLAINHLAIA